MLFDQKMKIDFTVYSLKNDFRLMMPCMRISQNKTIHTCRHVASFLKGGGADSSKNLDEQKEKKNFPQKS